MKPPNAVNAPDPRNRSGEVKTIEARVEAAGVDCVDAEVLHELIEVLSVDLFTLRLSAFKVELASIAPTLRALRNERDPDRIGKQAHRFAGGAAIFGAVALHDRLAAIESAARRQQLDGLDALISDAETMSEATIQALDRMRFPAD